MFSRRNIIIALSLIAIGVAGVLIGRRVFVNHQISKARAAMLNGRFQTAINELAVADRFQPGSANVQFEFAIVWRRMDEADNFRVHLAEAARLGYPNPVALDLQKKLMETQRGQNIEANESILMNAPDEIVSSYFIEQVLESLARGNISSGNLVTANKVLLQWKAHNPDSLLPFLWDGRNKSLAGDDQGAIDAYRECLQIDPKSKDAALAMFMVAASELPIELNEDVVWEETRLAVDQALQRNPDDSSLLAAAADTASHAGDVEKAERLAERTLNALPDEEQRSLALTLLGTLKCYSGQYSEAERLLNEVVSLKPVRREPYFRLAQVYRAIGDNEKADSYLERAEQVEDAEKQMSEIQKSLQTNPNDVELLIKLAEIHQQYDHDEQAAECLVRAAQLEPDNSKATDALFLLLRQPGREALSDRYLKRPETFQPGTADEESR